MESRLLRALPKGSGFDCDWEVVRKKDKLVATTDFHVLNEHGYYDGFIGIKVTIPYIDVKFFDSAYLNVVATNWRGNPLVRKHWTNNQLGDYIWDTVRYSLETELAKMKGV